MTTTEQMQVELAAADCLANCREFPSETSTSTGYRRTIQSGGDTIEVSVRVTVGNQLGLKGVMNNGL